ncbi:hypothetical protein IFM89_022023 [Coptis chinensis]|uniref:Uncharacterized protein n=1 Tax=Coptis chinensis TaxID=261450 RepID=A0A835I5H7_9MAGN|nr:hypothetical protein IFM89_022023 [Coptis chinensis]
MSLSLIQSYSSDEEEEQLHKLQKFLSEEDDDDDHDDTEEEEEEEKESDRNSSRFEDPNQPNNSILPSAFDAFSEVSGPPGFLNNSVAEHVLAEDAVDQSRGRRGGRKYQREKQDLPAGVVLEAKAQLVGIRERVRSDMDGNHPPTSSVPSQKGSPSTVPGEGKRVVSATNPDAKDAAELLRMCLQCGIPKTYSSARGMVCPVCGDRPIDPDKESDKKKGSTVKDKEKNKRMKGQSSHSTWKSETEMQLRQQFD